jgi:hypothetical protein
MGNPDSHDILKLARLTAEKKKVLVWSGSLEKIREARAITGSSRILALPENRYGATDMNDARERLRKIRKWEHAAKRNW